jgi:3-methyl-2-oxobutanoate hydroxymethyltransferase
MDDAFKPKFVKRYAELGGVVAQAIGAYAAEVRAADFPAEEHSFHSATLRLVQASDEEPADDAQVIGAPV